jgi:hypothetical protein
VAHHLPIGLGSNSEFGLHTLTTRPIPQITISRHGLRGRRQADAWPALGAVGPGTFSWSQRGGLTLAASEYTASITAQNFAGTEPFTATEWGTYTLEGAVLTFVRDSFDLVPLLLSPATVSGNVIELGLGGEGPGAPDQFRAGFVRAP